MTPEWRYVYIDFGQFEAGILAGMSQNQDFQKLYESDMIYERLSEIANTDRDMAKIYFYCFVYGGIIKKGTERFFETYNLKTTVNEEHKFTHPVLSKIDFSKKVIFMTAHRRENLGEPLKNICEAVKQYKYEYDKKNNGKYQALKAEVLDSELPTYRVQLFAVKEELGANHPSMKGEKNLTFFKENGYFKYTSQPVGNYEEAKKLHAALKEKFSDCFIIAFYKGEKISVKKALSIKK